jgi:hypothetical protein
MKRNNVTIEKEKTNEVKATPSYSFYSRVLEKPFDTIEELAAAEAAHYEKLKAKEDAAAQKKADAAKVEDAFKALNAARKTYKEEITQLTKEYAESLENLKKAFDLGKQDIANTLATAEEAYQAALKEFTDKYDSYHVSLKDGDFETTISKQTSSNSSDVKPSADFNTLADLFDALFNF